ncbi:MAG: hypothetical protein ACLFUU_03330 [Desulfobacteraceae bacterium]
MKILGGLVLIILLFLGGCSQESKKQVIRPPGPPASTSGWPQDATCSPGCPAGGF